MPSLQATAARLKKLGVQYDQDDLPILSQFSWAINVRTGYAFAPCARPAVYQHRLIACAAPGEMVDHRNGDRLDNRVSNLRIVTREQNGAHRTKLPTSNRSGHLGVHWCNTTKRWRAKIVVNRRTITLGSFRNKPAAVLARRRAEDKFHGPYRQTVQP